MNQPDATGPSRRIVTELCVDSVAGVRIAASAGADRVELCSALECGGLTPSAALIEQAVAAVGGSGTAVHVLIRPRPGDYRYAVDEIRCMERDIAQAVDVGVQGVVIGALRTDGTVDLDVTSALVAAARSAARHRTSRGGRFAGELAITFHRAFDVTPDPYAALEAVRSTGIDRILTSGQAVQVEDGTAVLAELVRRGDDETRPVRILAGGGVRAETIAGVVAATGVPEIHFSARREFRSGASFRPLLVNANGPDRWDRHRTDPETVRAILRAVQG